MSAVAPPVRLCVPGSQRACHPKSPETRERRDKTRPARDWVTQAAQPTGRQSVPLLENRIHGPFLLHGWAEERGERGEGGRTLVRTWGPTSGSSYGTGPSGIDCPKRTERRPNHRQMPLPPLPLLVPRGTHVHAASCDRLQSVQWFPVCANSSF